MEGGGGRRGVKLTKEKTWETWSSSRVLYFRFSSVAIVSLVISNIFLLFDEIERRKRILTAKFISY